MSHHGFTDLLLSMAVPSLDATYFGLLDADCSRVDDASPSSTRSRSVASECELEGGDGARGAESEEGYPSEEAMEYSSQESDPVICSSTELWRGDGIRGAESEDVESREEAMADSSGPDSSQGRDQIHGSPRGSDERTTQESPDSCSPGSDRPWKKRPRHGEIPEFREPSSERKSALEAAVRKFGDRDTAHVIAPDIGMEFDSLAEAYEFFNLYSWEIGFGIRYSPHRKNQSNSMQDVPGHCLRMPGRPRHLNSRSVSCGCQAMIRIHRTTDHGWFINEFRPVHNHGLSVTCGEKMHWSSHRSIDPHTKMLVKNLRDNNVGLTKVLSVIGSFFGSMENIPFNKRSLRTLCASISRDHSEDDVMKTCELFSELKMKDPNFVDSVLSDKEGRIRALMWTNGKSRLQYKCFGDAIIFDTTYQTNKYRMLFGLFVGVNNHFQSIILGGVLLSNETKETFEWVFKEFVNLMDQCRAMELAVAAVLPETSHRWCKWHVLRRAKECMGALLTRNDGFRDQFHKICEYMLTVEEFETAWSHLINDYDLHDHPILTQIYDIRQKWAKPYFAATHIDADKREKWSRISYEVQVESQGEEFRCECKTYEHMGMLCCHAIRVMMHMDIHQIPERHIMKRWTRDACILLPDHLRMYQKESPAMKSTSFRHTALYRTAIEMVNLGDSNPESYQVAMDSMLTTMPVLAAASKCKDGLGLEERAHADEIERAGRSDDPSTGSGKKSRGLGPDMVAPPRSKDMGRPTSARVKPGYEVSRPRAWCVAVGAISRMDALRFINLGRRHGARQLVQIAG